MSNPAAIYRRVLLKLSGEALLGEADYGIDPDVIDRVAQEIKQVAAWGVQLGVVIGGGNIFRGAGLARAGMTRVTGDHMGMLATVMNSLALQDALEKMHVNSCVLSALSMPGVCEDYTPRRAIAYLEQGKVALFAAGTGNPFFTTDTAASLRAIEIQAQLLLKATKVDGVYDADPMRHRDAVRYAHLSYDEVLIRRLGVMDMTAIVLCQEHGLPLRVFDIKQAGALLRIIQGDQDVGTLVDDTQAPPTQMS